VPWLGLGEVSDLLTAGDAGHRDGYVPGPADRGKQAQFPHCS